MVKVPILQTQGPMPNNETVQFCLWTFQGICQKFWCHLRENFLEKQFISPKIPTNQMHVSKPQEYVMCYIKAKNLRKKSSKTFLMLSKVIYSDDLPQLTTFHQIMIFHLPKKEPKFLTERTYQLPNKAFILWVSVFCIKNS